MNCGQRGSFKVSNVAHALQPMDPLIVLTFVTGTPKINVLVIALLFAAGAAFSYWSSSKLPHEIRIISSEPHNVWFEADIARVYSNMTKQRSNHYRTKVHPLFSISTYPVIDVLHKFGASKALAVTVLMSTIAGLWLILLYSVFRFLDLHILDAILFSSLALVSSAALFWISVPETFLFGSASILLVFAVSAAAKVKVLPESWYMVLSATSLSMTVTNWMAGIANTFVNNPWKRSVQITINAFFIVAILWALQKWLFPSAVFFTVFKEETNYVLLDKAGGFLDIIRVFFAHSMVMPEVAVQDNPLTDKWPQLSVQFAEIGSTGAIGLAGITIWLSLLFYGAISMVKDNRNDKFRLVLGLTIAGQLLLHLLYGNETFLYSLHWLPLLVIISSYGALTSLRPIVIAGTVVLLGIAASNNLGQFDHAIKILHAHAIKILHASERNGKPATERQLLINAIKDSPSLSWPRGKGHVILGNSGSSLEQKAYHEPGGNFSPGFTSFGVSFEFFDAQGSWVASSNSIPMDKIEQRLEADSHSIITRTPLYKAAWRPIEGGSWRLDFESTSVDGYSPVVKISSAGPAGGPIQRLDWEDNTLTVNQDQAISITPAPELVLFQDEREALIIRKGQSDDRWRSEDGFSTALLVLSGDKKYSLDITSKSRITHSDERYPHDQNRVSVSLSDSEFERSLDAQVFHLLGGIVGSETRPGDPANYPLNWLRDGAYVIVALAKAGQINVARSLAGEFFERDYFGGFGAEADAPGLAIWALDEVATRVDDVDFTKDLWPHIKRKAHLILEMLDAKRPISKPFSGPIVPSQKYRKYHYLSSVAKASKNGLIRGKMDNHYPIIFVNAVSYLGLTRAAEFAVRVGDKGSARHYLERAASLKAALSAMLEKTSSKTNPRTLIFGLWPSNVFANNQLYVQLLQEDWEKIRTPSGDYVNVPRWTYFNVAKAHQWLLAGDLDRTWKTLRWFWDNQASPGLYTWWEGDGEENSFHLWENARGWITPPHVTPHYWTAAEMLLLQLDMLAYENERDGETHIVIGGGFPPDMLKDPISVNGLQMRNGRLDWDWNGERVLVKWHGRGSPDFVLGKGFPADTDFEVMFSSSDQDRQTHSTEPQL
jgi:hypothetical protein